MRSRRSCADRGARRFDGTTRAPTLDNAERPTVRVAPQRHVGVEPCRFRSERGFGIVGSALIQVTLERLGLGRKGSTEEPTQDCHDRPSEEACFFERNRPRVLGATVGAVLEAVPGRHANRPRRSDAAELRQSRRIPCGDLARSANRKNAKTTTNGETSADIDRTEVGTPLAHGRIDQVGRLRRVDHCEHRLRRRGERGRSADGRRSMRHRSMVASSSAAAQGTGDRWRRGSREPFAIFGATFP